MPAPPRIVLASGNQGKLRELRALLAPWPVQLVAQCDLGVPEVEETGVTFADNALIKARHAAAHTGLPALADDSGIEVDALGGAPGVRSARYAGVGATDAENLQLLLTRVRAAGATDSAARFRCVIAFVSDAADPHPTVAHGAWEGCLAPEPRGANGFGYDPIFFVPDHGCTSAQLEPALKNRISHRARAMGALLAALGERFGAMPGVPGEIAGGHPCPR